MSDHFEYALHLARDVLAAIEEEISPSSIPPLNSSLSPLLGPISKQRLSYSSKSVVKKKKGLRNLKPKPKKKATKSKNTIRHLAKNLAKNAPSSNQNTSDHKEQKYYGN